MAVGAPRGPHRLEPESHEPRLVDKVMGEREIRQLALHAVGSPVSHLLRRIAPPSCTKRRIPAERANRPPRHRQGVLSVRRPWDWVPSRTATRTPLGFDPDAVADSVLSRSAESGKCSPDVFSDPGQRYQPRLVRSEGLGKVASWPPSAAPWPDSGNSEGTAMIARCPKTGPPGA